MIVKTAAQRATKSLDHDSYGVTSGVSFDGVHSFRDWGLYLRERPKISPPEPKTTYVSIPCRDGDIDISTALTDGEIKYGNREIELSFSTFGNVPYWPILYSRIQNYLHGKESMKIIFDNDPAYYYTGRVTVNAMESDHDRGYLSLTINADPYKKDVVSTVEDWLWDPFSFIGGEISGLINMEVSGSKEIELTGDRETVIPKITVSSGPVTVSVKWKSDINTVALPIGTHENYDLRIREGKNIITFTGNSRVTFDYRGGSL